MSSPKSPVKPKAVRLSALSWSKLKLTGVFNAFFRAQSRQFYNLLGVSLLLVVFGLVMVLSSSSIDSLKAHGDSFSTFNKQVIFAFVGILMLVVVSLIPLKIMNKFSWVALLIALGLQAAVFISPLGISVNGNKNWLSLGIFTIQPSEFIKLTLILFIATVMAAKYSEIHDTWRFSGPVLFAGFIAIVAVMRGGDLGTTIIIALILFGSLFLAGAPAVAFRLPIALAALGAIGFLFVGSSRLGRIIAWLNPGDDSNPYTWQSLHGVWALAAGRFTGAGLGQSKLKWSWIPEVENDFIFAIIGEEFGLIGALSVIALFLFLFGSMIQIFLRTEDNFSRFVAGGILVWISLQSIINIMVVLQLAPVLGVPLPLISAGGSSLISSLLAIGVMLGIERQNHASALVRGSRRPTRSAASQAAANPRARN